MNSYFGFAISALMFAQISSWKEKCVVIPSLVDPDTMKPYFEKAISCVNHTHKPTIEAAKNRYRLNIQIPEKPPSIILEPHDTIYVMSVNLPRLEGRNQYTQEEIEQATFIFYQFNVVPLSAIVTIGAISRLIPVINIELIATKKEEE